MKFSNYLKVFETEKCSIIYSTLYQRAIKIYDDEIKALIKNIQGGELIEDKNISLYPTFFKALQEYSFIIEDNYAESDLVNYLYENNFLKKGLLEFIIIPTRDCNFRCPYCYEEHEKRSMDDTTYSSIIDFIEKIINTETIKTINISWFGGEPLLEHKNIINFMKNLEAKVAGKCLISGSMTTNGYLLNLDLLSKLVNYHITRYQITVDGLKEFHDITRILSNGFGSWDRIMQNLLEAKKSHLNFKIMIRTNYTDEMLNHYKEWLSFLKGQFGDDTRFQFHSETVRDLGGNNKDLVVDDTKDPLKNVLIEMCNLKMESFSNTFKDNFCFMCYAGLPYSFLIDYDGTIKKCTVRLDEEINNVGTIKTGIDFKKMAWWTNYSHNEKCKSCFIYPLCFGKKCPGVYYNFETCKNYKNYITNTLSNIIQGL